MGIAETTNAIRRRPLVFFGGAFDPIHNGHLWLARRAAACFLATVRLSPNGAPTHRPPPAASWRQRMDMCEIAATGARHIEVGADEPPGRQRFAVDALRALRRQAPDRTLLLLVGADAFSAIGEWRQWRRLFDLAHVIVAGRAGVAPPTFADKRLRRARKADLRGGAGGVYLWRCAPPAIAGKDIRAAIAAGRPANRLLPPPVLKYVADNGLYSLR